MGADVLVLIAAGDGGMDGGSSFMFTPRVGE